MSALPSSTPVLQLPRCQHIFCRVCLDQWWGCAPHKSCPTCRTVYSGLRHLQREELTAGDLLAAASSEPNNNEDCALTKSDFAGGAQTAAVLGGSDDEEEFVVEAICGARTRKGAAQFEVKWKGHPRSDNESSPPGRESCPQPGNTLAVAFSSTWYTGTVILPPCDTAVEVWSRSTGCPVSRPLTELGHDDFIVYFPDDCEYWLMNVHAHKRLYRYEPEQTVIRHGGKQREEEEAEGDLCSARQADTIDAPPAKRARRKLNTQSAKREQLSEQKTLSKQKQLSDASSEGSDPEIWYTTFSDHPWIGQRGLRQLAGQSIAGTVIAWLLPVHADSLHGIISEMALWKFQHDDNDLEDLEQHEVQAAIMALRKERVHLRKLPAALEAEAVALAADDWEALKLTTAVHAQVRTPELHAC